MIDTARILDSLTDGVIVTATDGTIRSMNRAASQLTGYAADDALRRPLEAIYRVVDGVGRARSTARGIMRGEGAQSAAADLELETRDGRVIPIEEACSALVDDDRRVVGAVVVFRDDSARRSWESALRESEALKSTIVDAALDAIISIDRRGRILDFNPAAEAMFGYRRDAVLGRTVAETIVPSGLRGRHERSLERYRDGEASAIVGQRVELTAMRSDGGTFPVELAVTKSGEGERVIFTGHVRNLTRQRAEAAHLETQLRLAAFGRDVGLAVSGRGGIKQSLERCAAAMVKHQKADVAAIWIRLPKLNKLALYALARAESDPAKTALDERALARHAGLIATRGEPLLTAAIESRPELDPRGLPDGIRSFAGHPMKADGKTIGVICLYAARPLDETTEEALESVANGIALGVVHRRAVNTLRRQAKSLREADARKDQFLAMLAHELRNPLTPLMTGLGLLASERADDQRIDVMRAQVEHLVRLVDDLLDVSRITRQRIDLRPERCRLRPIVDQAVALTREKIDAYEHHLSLELPAGDVWLDADPMRLQQVLANLLGNAAKYTPPGGRIDLTATTARDVLLVTVTDDGIGIEREFLERAFDLFAQADRTLSRSQGGLGVGLTLVKHVVEQHGGAVSVRSGGPNTGTSVRVRLPVASPPKAEPEEAKQEPDHGDSPPGSTAAPTRRVLIVDDNRESAEMVKTVIASLGRHEVAIAEDGPSGLAKAESMQPHLVLLDIGLPGLDGYEVARRMRRLPRFGLTRIVAVTGYSAPEHRRKGEEAGFDEHIVKPITVETIARLVAK